MSTQKAATPPPPTHPEIIRAMVAEYAQAEQRVLRMAVVRQDFRDAMLDANRRRQAALQWALDGLRISPA